MGGDEVKKPKYVTVVLKLSDDDTVTVEKIPIADIEEVVRCKKCVWGWDPVSAHEGLLCYCEQTQKYHKPDFYCADGKRRQK